MDKHEFSKIISEGLEKRKIKKQKEEERIFTAYVCDRSRKANRRYSEFRK